MSWDLETPLSPVDTLWLQRTLDVGLGGASCRRCGCTDNAACNPPCYWVETDLCSACQSTNKENHMQYVIGRHNVDDNGVPAGGITHGVGIHIEWQNGALREHGSDEPAEPNGAFVEGVIEAAIDRIQFYQSTRFACHENAEILSALEKALDWCHQRTANRAAQGVEGTHEVHDQPQAEPPLEPAPSEV